MPDDGNLRPVKEPVTLRLLQEPTGTYLPLCLGSERFQFLVDTGAPWTVISRKHLQQCGLEDDMMEVLAGGFITEGKLKCVLRTDEGYTLPFVVVVVRRLGMPLLGMNFLITYGCKLITDSQFPILLVNPPKDRLQASVQVTCSVYKECVVGGRHVVALLDTGSTHSFISDELFKKLKLNKRLSSFWPTLVILYDGSITVMFRKVQKTTVNIDGLVFKTDLAVHSYNALPLVLGMNILSGTSFCFDQHFITLDATNPHYVEGAQDPVPSLFSLDPPQFSAFSCSSHRLSSKKNNKFWLMLISIFKRGCWKNWCK